jgi:UDP-N-acetylglucosamine 3-dehydrogenase
MRAGVVGMGVMGKLHARVYRELGVLAAVCDSSSEVLSTSGWPTQAPCFTNLYDMLDAGVDAMSIAAPTPWHVPLATRCLERGCHVLVEKPMAPTLDEALRLVRLQEETGLVVGVGYIETYNPAFREVRDVVRDRSFGEITSVTIRRVGGLPRSADNVILDLMTHDIGLLMDLFGRKPDRVAVHRRGDPGRNVVNSAQALFSFGEASATCEANWVSPIKIRQIVVTGTGGFCEADLITQKVTRFVEGGNTQRWAMSHYNKEPLREELAAFLANCQLRHSAPMVDADRGYDILRVTLEAA